MLVKDAEDEGKSFCRIGDFRCSLNISVRAQSWTNPSRHHSGGVTCALLTFVRRTKENGSRKKENTPFRWNLGNRQPATFNVLKTSDWAACQNIKAHLWRPKSHVWREGGDYSILQMIFYIKCNRWIRISAYSGVFVLFDISVCPRLVYLICRP